MSGENMQVPAVVDALTLHRMQHAADEAERRELAEPLWGDPQVCAVDLHDRIKSGTHVQLDATDHAVEEPTPRLDGGNRCAAEALTHKHCMCWCGKFRKTTDL